jgi:hypothetical protein
MKICDKCKALDVRQLLIEAINNEDRNSATSRDVTFHLSTSSLRDSARNGCEVCYLIWNEFVELGKENQKEKWWRAAVDVGENVEEKLVSEEHSGPVLVSVFATESLKASLIVKIHGGPYYDQTSISMELFYKGISTYSSVVKARGAHSVIGSDFVDDQKIMDVLFREISPSTGSAQTQTIVSQWLNRCKSEHIECSLGHTGLKRLPTRVIDVSSSTQSPRLLETGTAHGNWIALSYCWGGDSNFILTSNSRPHFEQGIPLHEFPPTLRDAVITTRSLGIPYLWIDAICILQDSAEDWHAEAPRMKDVYSNADLVIAATSSDDVNAGIFSRRPVAKSVQLPWIFPIREPDKRNLQQEETYVNIRIDNSTPIDDSMASLACRWGNRGWTMQEDFLATRLLLCTKHGVTWECLQHAEEEKGQHITLRAMGDPNGRDQRDFMSRYWKRSMAALIKVEGNTGSRAISDEQWTTPYSMWYITLKEFSIRRLTKVSDRIPAISGLAALVRDITEDEYCAGLWRSDLLRGLLWQYSALRQDRSTVMENMNTSFEELAAQMEKMYLEDNVQVTNNGPSWSWASLDGTFESGAEDPFLSFSDDEPPKARVVDVIVELVTPADPFGSVRGGTLTIEASCVEWTDTQESTSSLQNHVAEILTDHHHNMTVEYKLRHDPYPGQITAILLIDCNSVQGRAILVESIQSSEHAQPSASPLFRRVGRFNIRKRHSYDTENPEDLSYKTDAEASAYNECYRGLSLTKTFTII